MSHSRYSRRELLVAGTSLAAVSTTGRAARASDGAASAAGGGSSASRSRPAGPQAPFDTLRDYVAALEANELLLRFPEVNQDAYEATGLVYRANDLFGFTNLPALWFDRVKIDGEWVKGPLLNLLQSSLHTDAITFGLPPGDTGEESYRRTKAHLTKMLDENGGNYPQIAPVTVPSERALCKEVILRGDEVDLTKFAFVQTNPADVGRYINATSVFTSDPELGKNFGTYRCQLKGPRLIGLNSEDGQAGWKMLMAARERGEKFAKVSIALGQDPVVWLISCSRVAQRFGDNPVDEMAIAGGLRGKPVELVRSETNDHLVPAHAEMIIEGEVPLQVPGQPEGPFGEMFGYLGARKPENLFMNVTCVTHRREPWVVNMYTGLQRGMVTAPSEAITDHLLRRRIPQIVDTYQHQDTMGVYLVSIDKTGPGQGLKAGEQIAKIIPIAKVVIVVDKDIDILDKTQVLFALGSRWRPASAHKVLEDLRALVTDPSVVDERKTSKMVIDATIQLPDEGGREEFPSTNRALLEEAVPEVFAAVDRQFGTALKEWGAAALLDK